MTCGLISYRCISGSVQTLQEMCIRFACSDQLLYDYGLSELQPHFKSALIRAKDAHTSYRIVYPRDIDFQ